MTGRESVGRKRRHSGINSDGMRWNYSAASFLGFLAHVFQGELLPDDGIERIKSRLSVSTLATALYSLPVWLTFCGENHGAREMETGNGQERLALTYREAGAALGLSDRTIWSMVAAGKLRAVRFGRSVRIAKSELERYLGQGGDKTEGQTDDQ